MKQQGRSRRWSFRQVGEWLAVVGLAALFVLACAPEQRSRVLTLLFDGVPDGGAESVRDRSRRAPVVPVALKAESISHHHASFASQCNQCHVDETTGGLADSKCVACHIAQPHVEGQSVDTNEARCSSCHREHQGSSASLTLVPVPRCTPCHKVHPFESAHPEFELVKADAEDVAEAKHATGLEVFHATHVKQTHRSGPRQGQALDCIDCHAPDSGGAGFLPPTFDEHCSACHNVPRHKNVSPPDWNELTKELAEGADAELLLLSNARWRAAEKELEQAVDEAEDERQEQLEEQLESLQEFRDELKDTEVGDCLLCHTLVERKVGDETMAVFASTRFRTEWFEKVKFSHQAHAYLACSHCHQVPASAEEELGRLMLPSITVCTACHREDGASNHCSVCHRYHDRTPIGPFGANQHEAIRLLNIGGRAPN